MFCMESILHEIMNLYKLKNLHIILIFCMYFVFILHEIVLYVLGLLGYHNIMRVQCSSWDSGNLGGSSGNFRNFKGC